MAEPLDPDFVRRALAMIAERLIIIEAELRDLRSLVTPLDPGSLPTPPEGDDT